MAARCRARLVVLSGTPPMGRFPALPRLLRHVAGLRAAALDRALRALAARDAATIHVPLPPVRPLHFAPDGYHPAPAGYRIWGDALGGALAARLRWETWRDR
jgi:lysophospholipase L1-like esterase